MKGRVEERPPVLHWFRSDLRVEDNVAYGVAATRASHLASVFVFDEGLLANERAGAPRKALLRACVERLGASLAARGQRLLVRRGRPEEVLPALVRETGARVVTWNRDASAFAKERDAVVRRALEQAGAEVHTFLDRVVFDAAEVPPRYGPSLPVFASYRRAWLRRLEAHPPRPPRRPSLPPPFEGVEAGRLPELTDLGASNHGVALPEAGEEAARQRLSAFMAGPAARYRQERDMPAKDGTSRLSPDLRLGTISVRTCLAEAHAARVRAPDARAGLDKWIDELIWREFYQAVLDDDGSLVRRNQREAFDRLEWENDEAGFEAWCEGRTGFPFVDAGMRELRATGWMHNRVRMVVASFLTKHLLIDWRRGERHFMRWLLDGDPAANSGGWQWAASTGTDSSPAPRIFNPMLQGERFDPDGVYLHRWLPELEALPGKAAHRPWEAPLAVPAYPTRIVDHAFARDRALERIARVASPLA